MSKLDERQRDLCAALAGVTDRSPTSTAISSCEAKMIDAVVDAVGVHGAAAAAVYAELVDLAVVVELNRTGMVISQEVLALIAEFQRDAVALVVATELSTNEQPRPAEL
jgi:hypothetical protein